MLLLFFVCFVGFYFFFIFFVGGRVYLYHVRQVYLHVCMIIIGKCSADVPACFSEDVTQVTKCELQLQICKFVICKTLITFFTNA